MSSLRTWLDQHHLLSFVGIAYAFTWTIHGALAYSGMEALSVEISEGRADNSGQTLFGTV